MRRSLTAVVVAAVLAAATATAAADFAMHRFEAPKPAPAFELPDLSGRTHRLSDLRGKVVLLFFWATW